jgi:uncharacterized protein
MNLSPTTERAEVLDVLRGIAIFGMFTVNMTADIWWSDSFENLQPGSADFLALLFVDLFTNGKFITIFSFLFGVGFYIQSERRIAATSSVASFWFRRLSGLLIIGLIATACTLPARILIDYSIFGLGLLLFYRLPPRLILAVAISMFVVVESIDSLIPTYWPTADVITTAVSAPPDTIHDLLATVLPEGSFSAISAVELRHTWIELTSWRYYVGDLDILALMLLGLYVGRIGAIWNRQIRVSLAKKTVYWLLGVGFICGTAGVAMSQFGLGDDTSIHHSVVKNLLIWPFGMPVLGLGYAAAIALMVDKEKWRSRLIAFAPIGRMALTNYLFTGFVAAFIGFQWGLGQYGKVFPAMGLLVVVGLLPVQMFLSRWWLRHLQFGPIEWLWRYWTYGQPPPIWQQNQDTP